MKNRLLTLVLGVFMLALASCDKEETKIFIEGATPPVLTSSVSGTIPMSFNTQDQPALKLSWTNPDYKFTSGPNSQNVTYQVEIDTTGANFTNPAKKIITLSNEVNLTLSQAVLNDYLLNQLQLNTTMNHSIEMRVRATLGSSALPLFSNVVKLTAKPYAIPPKVAPPVTGKLFIVGSATPGGWNNPVPVPTQELTQVSPTMYRITLNLSGGGSYLFLPLNGDWGTKYGGMGANNTNNPGGDDFKANGGDLIAPAASGSYRVEVDFQRGKFTVTKI